MFLFEEFLTNASETLSEDIAAAEQQCTSSGWEMSESDVSFYFLAIFSNELSM